jgi:2-polyprenyl-6-methoxyphenol hydroxylase-like FAD-dependent oxidoreductase
MWFHAYASSPKTSTCIVECAEATWQAHGFADRGTDDTIRLLEKIFHNALDGHSLISSSRAGTARWQRFLEVNNATWRHDNVVLLGDAAHTTHFTIGSGTHLAMIDAVVLAHAIYEHPRQPAAALHSYDRERRTALQPIQASARASENWFENVDLYLSLHHNASDFAYSMCSRQGEQPPWLYQQHLANQTKFVRAARRHSNNARRWYRAARRGQQPLLTIPRSLDRRQQAGQRDERARQRGL